MVQRNEQASRVLELARAEAEGFGHRYLGPEHLVLGILRDGDGGASQALGRAVREATRARRRGVGRVPRTPLREPPMLIGQVLYHAGEQARALGIGEVGPELLLWGVVTDIQTPWPKCMNNRWRRQLHASVGLPKGYRGVAGPLLEAFGIDLEELRRALHAELPVVVP